MNDAGILRIVATTAGVIILIIAGCVGTASLKQNKWWATALGITLSLVIVYVGYKTIRTGNFGAYYGT